MARDTFRSAIFFWMPDAFRHEIFNIGVALISKDTKFSSARFIDRDEFQRLHTVVAGPVSEETLDWYMKCFDDYKLIAEEATERGRSFPLRFDHPFAFTAMYGRTSVTSVFQWRDAMSGLLVQESPLAEMNYIFDRYVSHPTKGSR